ncbi:TerC family protein [Novipirellula artificiosorum]|uniref:Integral membrane protein TerC family protein n=1 Tax=Novipirellula artificiosorum TaxID=2528016 RepID=A0A5C6E2X8_9BACT|nr:TerC family protein [Novipirellula artificiosorum]TWU42854.1 Integral membrane protein TerC family protein [Novipirellula artificiosorum]
MLLASSIDIAEGASLMSFESLVALLALTAMEIVLGIDNIVFIAIITGRLPEEKRSFARRVGLFLAMGMRILLLLMIGWLISLQSPLLELSHWIPFSSLAERLAEDPEINEVSGRDLILLFGGLFLLYTAVREIHHKIEGDEEEAEIGNLPGDQGGARDGITPTGRSSAAITVKGVLVRIAFMDVIFSLDSVITAVGMANHIEIMIAAVVVAVTVMIIFANQISDFVQDHPTVKMLALSFLMLIGVVLVSDAVGTPINKGYVYFAMTFSLLVEFLNLRMKAKRYRPSHGEGETGSVG